MKIELKAFSINDGRAFIKLDDQYFLIFPPYSLNDKFSVLKEDILKAINFYTFKKYNNSFDDFNTLIEFLKANYIKNKEKQGIRSITNEELNESLSRLDDRTILKFIQNAKDELIPRGKIKEALNLINDISKLDKVKNNNLILDEINDTINDAELYSFNQRDLGNKEEAHFLFQLLTQKIYSIAIDFKKREISIWEKLFFDALEIAFEAELYTLIFQWYKEFKKQDKISPELNKTIENYIIKAQTKIKLKPEYKVDESFKNELLMHVILLNEEEHGKMRGSGNIIKEFYFIQDVILRESGYYLPIQFQIDHNPIYSKELSDKIKRYIGSGFIEKDKKDNSLKLTEKGKNYALKMKNSTEIIIRTNFSINLLDKLKSIIKLIGGKTSEELEEMEKELGFSTYQYGKKIF